MATPQNPLDRLATELHPRAPYRKLILDLIYASRESQLRSLRERRDIINHAILKLEVQLGTSNKSTKSPT